MININLLPEVLRKKERMPLPQFMALIGMLILIGFAFYMITKYHFETIPNLEKRERYLQNDKRKLTAQVEELKQITAEKNQLAEYVNTVKGLYKNRIIWSKVLADMKNMVNFDPFMATYNPEARYIWLTTFNGNGKNIDVKGFATASSELVAMQLPERLLTSFLTYTPATLPEKDEEQRLLKELDIAISEHGILRRDNPELPLQGQKEITIRQRLEEIKNMKSGGIALQPFHSQLVPGSLKLNSATWSKAPTPRGLQKDSALTEVFPEQAWAFDISMQLK